MSLSISKSSFLMANLYPSNATKFNCLSFTSKRIPWSIGLTSSWAIANEVPFIIFFNRFCGTSTFKSSFIVGNIG